MILAFSARCTSPQRNPSPCPWPTYQFLGCFFKLVHDKISQRWFCCQQTVLCSSVPWQLQYVANLHQVRTFRRYVNDVPNNALPSNKHSSPLCQSSQPSDPSGYYFFFQVRRGVKILKCHWSWFFCNVTMQLYRLNFCDNFPGWTKRSGNCTSL